jgi:putative FmdB family regulatory protein
VPNYEYECTQCAQRFEVWQSVGEEAPPCPECKSEVKKVFHVPRVIFKGSGFYVTDLRAEKEKSPSSGSTKASSADTADKPSSDKPGEARTTETKPGEAKSAESGSGSATNGAASSKSDATGTGSGSAPTTTK